MGIKIVKNMSVKKNAVTVTYSNNDDKLRKYVKHTFVYDNEKDLKNTLKEIAIKFFLCEFRFLPSCTSKSHEAYIIANDLLGGNSEYLKSQNILPNTEEWTAFQDKWVECFINFILNEKRHLDKYVILKDFVPVTVRLLTDNEGNIKSIRYATGIPKLVDYVTARIIVNRFGVTDSITIKKM